jgi:hypothetical protein
MQNAWVLASLWVGLALIATLLAIWCKISTALAEIVVGTVAQLIIGALFGSSGLAAIRQFSGSNGGRPRWSASSVSSARFSVALPDKK